MDTDSFVDGGNGKWYPRIPEFGEDDILLLNTLTALGQMVDKECNALPSVKQYFAQRQQILARIEAKYPGFTIDWANGKLISKPS